MSRRGDDRRTWISCSKSTAVRCVSRRGKMQVYRGACCSSSGWRKRQELQDLQMGPQRQGQCSEFSSYRCRRCLALRQASGAPLTSMCIPVSNARVHIRPHTSLHYIPEDILILRNQVRTFIRTRLSLHAAGVRDLAVRSPMSPYHGEFAVFLGLTFGITLNLMQLCQQDTFGIPLAVVLTSLHVFNSRLILCSALSVG